MVPEPLVDPDTTEGEGVGVADIDSSEEEAHSRGVGEALLEASNSDVVKEAGVIFAFEFLLAEGHDNADGSESLLSITGTLSVSSG